MMKSTAVGEGFRGPSGRLGFLLRQAQQSFRIALGDRLHDLGISPSQYTVLSLVELLPGSSGAELAVAGMLTPQSTNELLLSLTRRDLLRREPRPGDQRVRQVHLTDAGRQLMLRARPRVERLEDELLAELTEPERADRRAWLVDLALRAGAAPGDDPRPES